MATTLKGRRKKLATVIEEKAKVMRYNPLQASTSEVSPLHVYPELERISAFSHYARIEDPETQVWRNKALWYLIWLYSDDTVLNTKPPEPLPDRKLKALDLADFDKDPETQQFDQKVVHDLMHLGDHEFVMAILHYLRHQKGPIWAEIIVSEEQLFESMRLRLTPVNPSDAKNQTAMKKALRADAKELAHDIRGYWDDFWADNDDLRDIGEEILYQSLEDRARVNTGD